jgi:hypothetical protein
MTSSLARSLRETADIALAKTTAAVYEVSRTDEGWGREFIKEL